LQHLHSTDCINTWLAAWGAEKKLLPSVRNYASTGAYYNKNGGRPRSPLKEVLAKTKNRNTIDFKVSSVRGKKWKVSFLDD